MTLREELQNRADQLDAELLALSGRIRAIERESDDVHTCINALDIAEMDAQDAALEPAPAPAEPEAESVLYSIDEQTCEPVDPRCGAPAEQAPAKDTDDWRDNRRRFAHPTRFEDGPLGVSFNADDVMPDWLLLPDYVWTTQADGSVLVTPQAPALADPLSAELRSDPGSEENAGTNSDAPVERFPYSVTYTLKYDKGSGGGGYEEGELEDAERYFSKLSNDPDVFSATFKQWSRWNNCWELRASYLAHFDPVIDTDETHTDDLRTAEGETVAGDDRIAPPSVLDALELIAAVERAEATLAAAEPNYVGLQDPELDAEYEAMREREKADKPKLHFSIFGERGNRKLEEV